jgi:neutral amino acid transport system ATP-binding protein
MEPLLRIENLHAGYGDADVLHGVGLHLLPGEIVAIVGPNGAGKSTVLNAVMNLLQVRRGEIFFQGQSIRRRPTEALKDDGIAYVPQVANVFPSLTVQENLLVGTPKNQRSGDRLREVLSLFPVLAEKMKMWAGGLSGGERQMLAFACGLISGPRLLLLDEPSAALSPVLAAAIFEKVRAIRDAGTTILLVEQNVRKALEISDRGYVLDSGQNALSGGGRELLADPEMGRLYLGGSAARTSQPSIAVDSSGL